MSDRTMPTVRRADHVGFSVASVDAAIRFWVEVLGAHVVRTGEMGGDSCGR